MCHKFSINRRREERPMGLRGARRLNVERAAAARARYRATCGGVEDARRIESTYAQQVDIRERRAQ